VNPLISSFVVADVLFLVDTWTSGHVEAAIKSYKQALVLRADFPEATCNLLHTLQVFLSSPISVLVMLEHKIKIPL
jgi:hypothetical protein